MRSERFLDRLQDLRVGLLQLECDVDFVVAAGLVGHVALPRVVLHRRLERLDAAGCRRAPLSSGAARPCRPDTFMRLMTPSPGLSGDSAKRDDSTSLAGPVRGATALLLRAQRRERFAAQDVEAGDQCRPPRRAPSSATMPASVSSHGAMPRDVDRVAADAPSSGPRRPPRRSRRRAARAGRTRRAARCRRGASSRRAS